MDGPPRARRRRRSSAQDLAGVPSIEGTRWGGKTWIHPFELRMFPVVYNKELFRKAGLDPEHPPDLG